MVVRCPDTVSDAAFTNDSVGCSSETNFSFFVISDAPTLAQINSICASATCMHIVAQIKAVQPSECVVPFGYLLYAQFIRPIESTCNITAGSSDIDPSTIAVTTPPPPAPSPDTVVIAKKQSETTLLYGGGIIVLVVIVAVAYVGFRRCRRRPRTTPSKRYGEAFDYVEDTTEGSQTDDIAADVAIGPLNEELGAVRIPFAMVRADVVVSVSGNGEVARGVYNKQLVAIKRLPAGRRRDPASIQRFFEEIQLTSTLEHECIVPFIGVAWASLADLCMVSEFMAGGDLRLLLARYATNREPNGHDDAKLKMAVEIAHALTYLHTLSTPVVHRDLKSRNILLSDQGDAKLIDFGISCERQDLTMTAGVGTSLWMAPEVMLGQRYDEKADVFSFGVILSELDTHALPYDHAREPGSDRQMADIVLMQLIYEGKLKPRFTAAADPRIVTLANDCLQLDPTARPRVSEVLFRIHECRENKVLV